MVERIRVGVTGNSRRISPSWYCTALALRLAGAVPERIHVRRVPKDPNLRALVIGGGDDISPEHYGTIFQKKLNLTRKGTGWRYTG